METVSTLNPLATCFIPSSMKYQSISSTIFSVPNYEAYVNEYTDAKNRQLPITTDEQSIFLKVMKAQSKSIRAKILIDPFITIKEKETRYETIKKDEVVEPLITKQILSTMNEVSGKEAPVKPDDGKISERNCKGSIGKDITDSKDMETGSKDKDIIDSKDTILTKSGVKIVDLSLTNETVISKISELLKNGTKTLRMLLPFAVRSILVMEFFCRMGLRTIGLDVTKTSYIGSVFKFNSIAFPNKAKKPKIAKKRKSYECHPPMFGGITQFQPFGNQLMSETCDKDYVHPSFVEDLKLHQYEHSESNESSVVNNDEITLEQYSAELKAVIKDVCDSISVYDEDHDSVPKTRKRPVWETRSAKEIKRLSDPDLIDDGIHPLLQENKVDTDDTDIQKIQALLGQAFSLHNSSVDEILPSQSVCNPPCSVWCNKVPPPAKDAYKRFIRNMDSESTAYNKVTDIKKVLKKSFYKRCFSADDTPKNYDKMLFQSASSMESKERLLLLHKDPVSFIKQSRVSALKDISHKSKSNFFVSDQAAAKDNATESSDKWSLYDGADSKWQPLPDCMPSTDVVQKHAHRKARDMRRQKSVC